MNVQAFLVITSSGSLRIVKGRPYLNNNEIAIQLNLNIPKEFFTRLIPVVDINVPMDAVIKPDIETIVKITATEIAQKLQVDVADVEDGLRTALEKKEVGGGSGGGESGGTGH